VKKNEQTDQDDLQWQLRVSSKARYADNSGKKVGALVSENITLMVPEPSAGALLGLGLGMTGLALFRPRRR